MALIICPDCNKEISDAALACIHCGRPVKFVKPNNLNPPETPLQDISEFPDDTFKEFGTGAQLLSPLPYGIGGWLKFFIIAGVFGCIVGMAQEWAEIVKFKEILPGFDIGAKLYCVIIICEGLFGFYSLYLLARKHHNAVKFIKIWLILKVCLVVTAPFILYFLLYLDFGNMVSLSDILYEYLNDPNNKSLSDSIGMILGYMTWFWYFSVSKRVKNTWPHLKYTASRVR